MAGATLGPENKNNPGPAHRWNQRFKKGGQNLVAWQGRNKDADVENGLEDTAGKGKQGRSERVALTYIHYQM